MKSGTNDHAEGTLHQIKGKIKEIAGELSDNPKLEAEGSCEKMTGKVQEKIGHHEKGCGYIDRQGENRSRKGSGRKIRRRRKRCEGCKEPDDHRIVEFRSALKE